VLFGGQGICWKSSGSGILGFGDPGGGCLACIHLGAILICLCGGGQGFKIQDTCCSLNVLEIYFSKKHMTGGQAEQDGMCACELHLIESSEQQVKVFLSIFVQQEDVGVEEKGHSQVDPSVSA